MKLQKNTILIALSLLGLSFIASIFGLGHSYEGIITARAGREISRGIGPDGWISDGASISLRGLMNRGNDLELVLDPWRPSGKGAADLEVAVCGETRLKTMVSSPSGDATYIVPLKANCYPVDVGFKFANPFNASEEDSRPLGVKIKYAKVTSPVGVPLVDHSVILFVAGCIILLSLAVLIFSIDIYGGALSLSVPLFSLLILRSGETVSISSAWHLWVFLCALVVGAIVAKSFRVFKSFGGSLTKPNWLHEELSAPFKTSVVLAVVAIGTFIRFSGVTFGLPAHFHPDEVPKVNAIMRMVESGTLNPVYFLHPSLLLYSSYAVNTVLHWIGPDVLGVEGSFRDTAFLSGRLVSALAGSLSIYLVAIIGRQLFTWNVGVFSALIFSFLPLHVTCSRYMKEDALLTFWALLATALVLKSVRRDRGWILLLAGVAAGFAAGTKYTGMLSLCIVAAAPWLRSGKLVPDRQFTVWALCGIALMPIAFCITTPYAIITPDKFLRDFQSEANHMSRGHTVTIDPWSQLWMYHYWRSLLPGMGLLSSLVSVAALGFLLYRRKMSDLYLVALVLLYYLPAEWVKAKPEPQPERYVVPCLPFLSIALVEFLRGIRVKSSHLISLTLGALCFISPAKRSVDLLSDIHNDTRWQATNWMEANLPHGSKVGLDWRPYAPPFLDRAFDITYIPRATILEALQIHQLRRSEFKYLVLSSLWYDRYLTQPHPHAILRQVFRDIFDKLPIVAQFESPSGTYGFHNPKITVFALDPIRQEEKQ